MHLNENQCTAIPVNKAIDKPVSLSWSSQPQLFDAYTLKNVKPVNSYGPSKNENIPSAHPG